MLAKTILDFSYDQVESVLQTLEQDECCKAKFPAVEQNKSFKKQTHRTILAGEYAEFIGCVNCLIYAKHARLVNCHRCIVFGSHAVLNGCGLCFVAGVCSVFHGCDTSMTVGLESRVYASCACKIEPTPRLAEWRREIEGMPHEGYGTWILQAVTKCRAPVVTGEQPEEHVYAPWSEPAIKAAVSALTCPADLNVEERRMFGLLMTAMQPSIIAAQRVNSLEQMVSRIDASPLQGVRVFKTMALRWILQQKGVIDKTPWLPPEMWWKILGYLPRDQDALRRISRVCRLFAVVMGSGLQPSSQAYQQRWLDNLKDSIRKRRGLPDTRAVLLQPEAAAGEVAAMHRWLDSSHFCGYVDKVTVVSKVCHSKVWKAYLYLERYRFLDFMLQGGNPPRVCPCDLSKCRTLDVLATIGGRSALGLTAEEQQQLQFIDMCERLTATISAYTIDWSALRSRRCACWSDFALGRFLARDAKVVARYAEEGLKTEREAKWEQIRYQQRGESVVTKQRAGIAARLTCLVENLERTTPPGLCIAAPSLVALCKLLDKHNRKEAYDLEEELLLACPIQECGALHRTLYAFVQRGVLPAAEAGQSDLRLNLRAMARHEKALELFLARCWQGFVRVTAVRDALQASGITLPLPRAITEEKVASRKRKAVKQADDDEWKMEL